MNKAIKMVNILLVAMMLVMTFSPVVMATSSKSKAETIIGTMGNVQSDGSDNDIATIGGKIVNALTTVGIVVAVIVLLILGIKYMMGSASEKAEYKKTMIPYVVGAVLIFGASAIAKAVAAMASGLTTK